MTIPVIIISDSPAGNTGLGRIAGRIAHNIKKYLPEFRVGVAGIGGGSDSLGYPVYAMPGNDYGDVFPYIWREHCKGENGILLSVMNAAWLEWLAFPEALPYGPLREFALTTKMKKWCYVPVDAESAGGKLPLAEARILSKFDRVLAYTKFGSELIGKSLRQFPEWQVPWRQAPIPHLPHGTDSSVFFPRNRKESRKLQFGPRILNRAVGLSLDTLVAGIVATNSARKDWPLAFEILAELKARGTNVGMWAHTNQILGMWGDLADMAEAFGVRDLIQFTTSSLSDVDMSWGYAACDVVLGIGSGGGWEMPLSEALACKVPVVTGDYAGVTEFVPLDYRVTPWAWRYDPGFFCRRPVFRASDWADRILWAAGKDVELDPKFTWDGCWSDWEKWLREGVQS